jgi:hypothetical protein
MTDTTATIIAAWIEDTVANGRTPALTRMVEESRLGDCTADHDWWDAECWYTDDEKDEMAVNAAWSRFLPPMRPIDQTKHEWGQAYNNDYWEGGEDLDWEEDDQ